MINGYEICLNATNYKYPISRFQILVVQLHLGLFWSAGIHTMHNGFSHSSNLILGNWILTLNLPTQFLIKNPRGHF